MDATSKQSQNQLVELNSGRRNFIRATAALVAVVPAAKASAPAEKAPESVPNFGDQAKTQEALAHLCLMMGLMRSWYEAHRDRLHIFDRRMHSELHDLVIEGALDAREVLRATGIELSQDYIDSQVWGSSAKQEDAK